MKDILTRLSYTHPLCTCLTKTPETQYHDELCVYRVVRDAEIEVTKLKLALDVALKFHTPFMPGDSRAVPDWLVACLAVHCGLTDNDEEIHECLTTALEFPDMTKEEAMDSLIEVLTMEFAEELVCVNATDRCQGSFPCPYCEVR